MSANYPPGVTGNEPEIVGYDEDTREVECDSTGPTLMAHEVGTIIFDLAFRLEVAAKHAAAHVLPLDEVMLRVAKQLREDIGSLPEMEDAHDCTFTGEVDVVWTDRTTFTWECPRCGNDQEGEVD